MITVIIQGTKNLDNTLKSLRSNADGEFRVFLEDQARDGLSEVYDINFITSQEMDGSNLYWRLPSGVLILSASWVKRFEFALKDDDVYCLYPKHGEKYPATNVRQNIGKWEGGQYRVPILGVTEV